ncbi:uncharacterized protein JCM15063_001961 [Sporobolomyces koalae]|uniref:uncharacterized protein n=1 Tax=Sporobolomyces koalae TaxID=500713 RepID=UPI00317F5B4A
MTSKAFQHRPTFPLASQDLERWIRFSAKGGVGRARAIADRVSQDGHKDLMMLEGDEVIVLMDLGDDQYLGHCEGVVGLFRSEDVEFLQAKLKRPVMTPRSSRPSTSHNNLAAASQIRTNPVGLPESQNVDLNAKVTTRRMGDIQGLGIDSIEGQRTESGSAPQVAQSVDAVIGPCDPPPFSYQQQLIS